MAATGLSADPSEYRQRLADQTDEQIDIWSAELMRDVAKRRGVTRVIDDVLTATRLDERGFEQAFAAGGGPPAAVGRDRDGHVIVPTVALFNLVAGIRAVTPDGRDRLIDYLVANLDELGSV